MLKWFRRQPSEPGVRFDDERVIRTMSDGRTETVRWDELETVFIITTDKGPFVDDIFWVLVGARGGCIAPSEAEGTTDLVHRLQQLPGFDNRAVIAAMGCAENDRFVVWRRAGGNDKAS
jgi:hypothetical protein